MEKVMGFVRKKDNVISLLLVGTFAAMAVRSSEQQQEIDALEAEKTSLRSANTAMAAAMWSWRQHLFGLAEADPSKAPIPLARLRQIYGEDEPSPQGLREDGTEESISIA